MIMSIIVAIAWPPGLTTTKGSHIVEKKDQPNLSEIIKQICLIQWE